MPLTEVTACAIDTLSVEKANESNFNDTSKVEPCVK